LEIVINTRECEKAEAVGLILLLNTVSPGALQAAMNAIGNPSPVPAVALAAIENGYTVSEPVNLAAVDHDPETGEVFDDMTEAFGAPLDGADSAPPPAPGASDATPPTDKNGFPWDPRIHATTAGGGGSINKSDGLWRAKKGVADDLVASVQAELRAQGYAATAATAPPPPAAETPAPPPPAAETPAPPPAAPAAAAATPIERFQKLMKKVTPAQNAGKLTVVDIAGMCEAVGIKQLGELLTKPEHIDTIEAQVDALIMAAG